MSASPPFAMLQGGGRDPARLPGGAQLLKESLQCRGFPFRPPQSALVLRTISATLHICYVQRPLHPEANRSGV
jgi:hypothetical protein